MSTEGILSNTDLQFVFGANSVTISPVTNALNLAGTTNARVSVNNVNNIETNFVIILCVVFYEISSLRLYHEIIKYAMLR